MTTVPNCGGGAFKPATLFIVCGGSPTMATGVSWSDWGRESALGQGDVHLVVAGQELVAPARLQLSDPVAGPTGPQFSRLLVIWSGPSPDGHPSDSYHLVFVP